MLTQAANSSGGVVTYDYTWYRVSCKTSSTCLTVKNSELLSPWPGNKPRRDADAGERSCHNIYTDYYYGPPDDEGGEWGAVANDGGFLGFADVQITHYALTAPILTSVNVVGQFGGGSSRGGETTSTARAGAAEVERRPSQHLISIHHRTVWLAATGACCPAPTTTGAPTGWKARCRHDAAQRFLGRTQARSSTWRRCFSRR